MPSYKPITITASTTLDARHDDSPLYIDAAAGLTLTLPASAGNGRRFEIVIGTTVTSNNVIIQAANATDVMQGICQTAQDGGDSAVSFETASTSDTITLNGTTKGGIKGDRITLVDVATGFWQVNMSVSATGTEATPFSAAVS
jgi:hypothetical protein